MIRRRPIAVLLATLLAAGASPFAAADDAALRQELDALKERVHQLEEEKARTETALGSERMSEQEPEIVTRLKDVEMRALTMQKQARTIEALEGINAGVSFTTLAQATTESSVDQSDSGQWNYRADVAVSLPGGEIGNAEGNIFTQFRMGQGDGLTGTLPTYSGVNATGFRVQGVRPESDATVLLAQAWYQLDVPLPVGGFKPRSRETLSFNFGKMDPFLFFDQNAAADDETARFVNTAFVHNPLLDAGGDVGVDAFGFTPGLRLAYHNETRSPITWGASLGVFGAGTGATFEDSFNKPFAIAQLESEQRFFSGLAGNYRLYVWRNGQATPYANEFDAAVEAHTGWGLSVDQRIGDATTLFARYGRELDGKVRFDEALTAGAEFGGSYWDRGADSLGVAFGLLRTASDFEQDAPSLDADGDGNADFGYAPSGAEQVAEIYYRYRINAQFELSPNLQHIRRPAGDGTADAVIAAALRAQLTF